MKTKAIEMANNQKVMQSFYYLFKKNIVLIVFVFILKVGMRGLEAIAFVTFILVVLIISILTTITNLAIIYKLKLIPNMELITFVNDNILFHGPVDLDKMYLYKNQIEGNFNSWYYYYS